MNPTNDGYTLLSNSCLRVFRQLASWYLTWISTGKLFKDWREREREAKGKKTCIHIQLHIQSDITDTLAEIECRDTNMSRYEPASLLKNHYLHLRVRGKKKKKIKKRVKINKWKRKKKFKQQKGIRFGLMNLELKKIKRYWKKKKKKLWSYWFDRGK